MMCFGLPTWEFYVLCGGQDAFHIELEENPTMQEKIIREGAKFYKALSLCDDLVYEEALKAYQETLNEKGNYAIPMG